MIRFYRKLLERRLPQYIAGYVVFSLGLIEFTGFIINEFLLSPHLTRFVMVLLIVLFPSYFMVVYNHGRPGRDEWLKSEMICIPTNLVFAAVILFFLFRGQDLGAMTVAIQVRDENGNMVERIVPKSQYRKLTAMFVFDPKGLDDNDKDWLPYTIPTAIVLDMVADEFFDPVEPYFTRGSLRRAGFNSLYDVPLSLKREIAEEIHAERFFSGSVSRSDNGFDMSTQLHDSSGELIATHNYRGNDLLALVDKISLDLRNDLEIPERDSVKDLPAKERLTANFEALVAFGHGVKTAVVDDSPAKVIEYMQQAVNLDTTFTLAQSTLAAGLALSNRSQEARVAIQAALDNLYRLPERLQFNIKADYFAINENIDKSWAVIEMWAELYPNDISALAGLAQVQLIKNQRNAAIETYKRIYELNPGTVDTLKTIAQLQRSNGNTDLAIRTMKTYVESFPEDYTGFTMLSQLNQSAGNHDKAKEYLDRAVLMEPDRVDLKLSVANLNMNIGNFDKARKELEEALQSTSSLQEKGEVLAAMVNYHHRRGEMEEAIKNANNGYNNARMFLPPTILLVARATFNNVYIDAGRIDETIELTNRLRQELQPPMNIRVPFFELEIALELEDIEKAEALIAEADQIVNTTQAENLRIQIIDARGRVAELRENWDQALDYYRKALDLNPANIFIHTRIGSMLRHLGKLNEAEQEIRKTLLSNPANPKALIELSHVYEAMGDKNRAIKEMEDALDIWANADDVFKPAREARERLAELQGQNNSVIQ